MAPTTYSIELAAPRHLKMIPGIEVAAASLFSEADLPIDVRYRISDPNVLQAAQSAGRLWVALDGHDHAVGFAMIEIVDGLAHIDEIDVHPDHAKQGVGSSLMQAMIDWAMQGRYEAMTLVTFRHVVWNAPFYEKIGFVELKSEALGPELRDIYQQEAAAGLNMQNRIAMQRSLI